MMHNLRETNAQYMFPLI